VRLNQQLTDQVKQNNILQKRIVKRDQIYTLPDNFGEYTNEDMLKIGS
jgi:hypothetical protein